MQILGSFQRLGFFPKMSIPIILNLFFQQNIQSTRSCKFFKLYIAYDS